MAEGSAHRNIDEQQPQSGIAQLHRRVQFVKPFQKQKSTNRHRGRFGDERAQQRSYGQDRKPPGRRRTPSEGRNQRETIFGKPQNRLRSGDGHHDKNKDRLGIIDAVEIAHHRIPSVKSRDGNGQRNGPDAENGFDLPQKMKQSGSKAESVPLARRPHFVLAFQDLEAILETVRDGHELRGQKGVANGKKENHRRDQIERIFFHPPDQSGPERGRIIVSITLQGRRKDRIAIGGGRGQNRHGEQKQNEEESHG